MTDNSTSTSPAPRLAVVTGASRGIGLAAARQLADAGFKVVAAARDVAALEQLAADNPRIIAERLDMLDTDSLAPFVQRIEAAHGPIEVLVNNAGYGFRASIEESPTDAIRRLYEVNLFGLLALTSAVLPGMRHRGRGRIIMVSSAGAWTGVPISGIYSSSKFALRAASDALRREVKWLGVDIIQVEPGPVRTDFAANAAATTTDVLTSPGSDYRKIYDHYLERVKHINSGAVTADAVARVMVRAATARRPRVRYRVHWIARVVPWLGAILPEWWMDRILAKSLRKVWLSEKKAKG